MKLAIDDCPHDHHPKQETCGYEDEAANVRVHVTGLSFGQPTSAPPCLPQSSEARLRFV